MDKTTLKAHFMFMKLIIYIKSDKAVFSYLLVFLLSACSYQQLYEATQHNRKLDCQTRPPVDQQQCLDDLNKKTYREYQESREGL